MRPKLGRHTCANRGCAQAAEFHVFDPTATAGHRMRRLCDEHAHVVIDEFTRQCAATRLPELDEQPDEFRVAHIVLSDRSTVAIVYLSSGTGSWLSIQTGSLEAWRLVLLLTRQGRDTRPLTHEAMAASLEHLGAVLVAVEIDDVVEGEFHAKLHLLKDGASILCDMRPSDAIALAFVRALPIRVAPLALRKAQFAMDK